MEGLLSQNDGLLSKVPQLQPRANSSAYVFPTSPPCPLWAPLLGTRPSEAALAPGVLLLRGNTSGPPASGTARPAFPFTATPGVRERLTSKAQTFRPPGS